MRCFWASRHSAHRFLLRGLRFRWHLVHSPRALFRSSHATCLHHVRISGILLLGVVVGYQTVKLPLAHRAPSFKSFLKFLGVAAEGVVTGHNVGLAPVVVKSIDH